MICIINKNQLKASNFKILDDAPNKYLTRQVAGLQKKILFHRNQIVIRKKGGRDRKCNKTNLENTFTYYNIIKFHRLKNESLNQNYKKT